MVTSTTVYADLVSRIGGDLVEANPVINSVSQDPHSYEATSRDKLALSKAQLVVANGGGYDTGGGNGGGYDVFMDVLAKDLKPSESTVINAVDTSPVADDGAVVDEDHAEDSAVKDEHAEHGDASCNEHVWYDVESMRLLTEEISQRLAELRPEAATTFTSNSALLTIDLKNLETEVADLRGSTEGKQFAMTEPVPFHLLEDLGMNDATPEGLSESIEACGEVSPQAFNEMSKLFEAGDIDVLAYNIQVESPQTERIEELADAAKVPVIDFTGTLPLNTDYVSRMESNIRALEVLAR